MLWLLKFINPVKAITREIFEWKLKQADAKTEQQRIEAEVEIETLTAQKEILLAEQSNFFTRIVRPSWSWAFIIYTWKVIVWDKVVMGDWKNGVTDALDANMWSLMMLIAGSYFVFRGGEKLIKMWKK